MARIPSELEQLARLYGVQTSYLDVSRRRQDVSAESLFAVLETLGLEVSSLDEVPDLLEREQRARLERGIEPVIVLWDKEAGACLITLPKTQAKGKVELTIDLEGQAGEIKDRFELGKLSRERNVDKDFASYRLPIPSLEGGYHQLSIKAGGRIYQSLLISAPRRAYAADASGGEWGSFLPLYSLRSERNWGAGDFTDLEHFVQWVEDLDGRVVGTLPLLAAFLDEPFDPSPYAPASRLAWNEFYVDAVKIPELANNSQLKETLGSEAFTKELAAFRTADYVDYRGIMERKRRFLQRMAEDFFDQKPSVRFAEFERFLKTHPHLEDYAEFRAAHEQQRRPWTEWPPTLQKGKLSEGDYDSRNKQYHLYAQWIATSQLESLAEAAGGGLYLDLPLGVRPDGYDVWRWNELYADQSSAGAPPDAMWTKGQDWGFPPLHPERIREQGYRHVRDYLRHHLRLARILRIDHVMQLHRLYWVPQGMPASRGAYVQYRAEEFYAILSLESHRTRTTLVGENLGTVPAEVNKSMDRHNLQGMYVVQYEIASNDEDLQEAESNGFGGLRPVRSGALASMNTHDMASFAAWWRGEDILLRHGLDLIDEKEADKQRQELETLKENLTQWLSSESWLTDSAADEPEILSAILKYLAASDAGVVLVNLEDLWLETEPQNVPGTAAERPNWSRKAALSFEEFSRSENVLDSLHAVAELRAPKQNRTD